MENNNLLKNLEKHFYFLSTREILNLMEDDKNEIDILAHAEEILPEVILSDSIKCKFNEDEDSFDFDDFKFNEALNDFFDLAKTSVALDMKMGIEKDLRFCSNKCSEEINYPNRPPVIEVFLSVEQKDFIEAIKKNIGNRKLVLKLDNFR